MLIIALALLFIAASSHKKSRKSRKNPTQVMCGKSARYHLDCVRGFRLAKVPMCFPGTKTAIACPKGRVRLSKGVRISCIPIFKCDSSYGKFIYQRFNQDLTMGQIYKFKQNTRIIYRKKRPKSWNAGKKNTRSQNFLKDFKQFMGNRKLRKDFRVIVTDLKNIKGKNRDYFEPRNRVNKRIKVGWTTGSYPKDLDIRRYINRKRSGISEKRVFHVRNHHNNGWTGRSSQLYSRREENRKIGWNKQNYNKNILREHPRNRKIPRVVRKFDQFLDADTY